MKRIILLSGGIDSTVLLYYLAKERRQDISAIFFDYGQKSVDKERETAEYHTKTKGVPLLSVCLQSAFSSSSSSLIARYQPIVEEIKRGNDTEYISKNTEVEFRNGVMLAVAISMARQLYPNEEVEISYGAIQTREQFADCSREFVKGYDAIARLCTDGKVTISAPFINMGKDEVYSLAKQLGVDIKLTWSCYDGGDKPCGKCPACLDRKILEEMNANQSGEI